MLYKFIENKKKNKIIYLVLANLAMFLTQTTSTAGTVKASIAENKSARINPTYATDLSKVILKEATITKTTVVNKYSLVSLPVIFKAPTTIPKTISKEVRAV